MGNRCVVGFVGSSGSGKTTLMLALVRVWTAAGLSVSAIKHTHHPLNEERRGDSQRFLDAGAQQSILCGEGQAVVFTADAVRRARYESPEDLARQATGDRIVIEGFKDRRSWPTVLVGIDAQSIAGVDLAPFTAVVLRRPSSIGTRSHPPLFSADELAGSQAFLDTICPP